MKGLLLSVLKGPYESTNGGLSSKVKDIVVVGLGPGSEVFDATPERPAFRLESHVRGCVRLVPVDDPREGTHAGPMFGGNYATGDSRFTAAIEKLTGARFYGAVCIHDRYDTWEDHEALTR